MLTTTPHQSTPAEPPQRQHIRGQPEMHWDSGNIASEFQHRKKPSVDPDPSGSIRTTDSILFGANRSGHANLPDFFSMEVAPWPTIHFGRREPENTGLTGTDQLSCWRWSSRSPRHTRQLPSQPPRTPHPEPWPTHG
jgi:hypothetical protein